MDVQNVHPKLNIMAFKKIWCVECAAEFDV